MTFFYLNIFILFLKRTLILLNVNISLLTQNIVVLITIKSSYILLFLLYNLFHDNEIREIISFLMREKSVR